MKFNFHTIKNHRQATAARQCAAGMLTKTIGEFTDEQFRSSVNALMDVIRKNGTDPGGWIHLATLAGMTAELERRYRSRSRLGKLKAKIGL